MSNEMLAVNKCSLTSVCFSLAFSRVFHIYIERRNLLFTFDNYAVSDIALFYATAQVLHF